MSRESLIQVRRGTATQWYDTNPTLAVGEIGFETDTGKLKVGTASTAWNSLPYVTDASDVSGVFSSGIFSGNTSTDLVKITQAGTGNAFVVEDVASDTTPFVINASGNVGVGTSSPSTALHVVGTVTATTFAGALSGNATTATNVAYSGLTGIVPTWNQNTTGSAATLTTTRTLWGQNFNGSANVSGALTGVGTVALSGATSGTTTVQASAVAGTTTITLPAVTGTVVTTGDTGSITSTMIFDGTILNADINASAGISLSKLALGTSAQVVIVNASGVPTYTTISGDITISNTGVATIAADSIALGTDTTGNYVGTVTAGTGIATSGASTGEGIAHAISLASGVVTIGTYKSVTVDTYGRVTAGTNPTTLAGYGITDAPPPITISTSQPSGGNDGDVWMVYS